MAGQTTYNTVMEAAFPGLLYDMRNVTIESYACESDSIALAAQWCQAPMRKQVKAPTAGGQGFRGVALHEYAHEQDPVTGVAAYLQYETVNVLRKGAVWVRVKGAVAENATAYYLNGSSSADDVGLFHDVDDSTTDPTSSGTSRAGIFRSAASASGLAVLEISDL